MSTVTKYLLDNQETQPYREAMDLVVSAVFGLEPQASISIDDLPFVDTDKAKNSQTVRTAWVNNPVEGLPFALNIANGNISYDFRFYLDYTRMKFLSDVETVVGAKAENSLQQFDFRSQAITQRLLFSKDILTLSDFQNVPYIVKNRKTVLEKIMLVQQAFIIAKTIVDEVFKLINIASDLPTGGGIVALFNLTTTIGAIVNLVQKLKDTIEAIKEAFFPDILFHSGIKPKVFIEKAIDFMGYSGVEFGTLTSIMDKLTILGSKNNQEGILGNFVNPTPGLMNPKDVGYHLFDMKEQLKNQFRLREAVIDNVYHLRPEKDPFWVNTSTYVMPSVLIEQTFANNGTIRPNYEDLNSSTIIEYSTDDSDLWTLDDLEDESDPNSTGKIISVTTVDPIVVQDQRKVLLKGSKNVEIPYALAVRKDVLDDLLDFFFDLVSGFEALKQDIQNNIDEFLANDTDNPFLADLIAIITNRDGALVVENHFFSVAKMMLIEDNSQGEPRIPDNFVDLIGAKALYQNFHSYDSFINGQRNPSDPNETAAKLISEGVRIPFGLDDFNSILINSYFSTQEGKTGKFTKVDWNVRGDFAICDWWIYDNWMSNIVETIS